ncbi:MAG: hypothetical protein P8Q97_10320 [Myxococcota bacterium]|nr:hypothetical protein [Myxococcota bacterium]
MTPSEVRLLPRRIAILLLLFFGVCGLLLALWDPTPRTDTRFDRGINGIWLGHKWYTGKGVRTGDLVSQVELEELGLNLEKHGIRDLFIHVGPALPSGELEDSAGDLFKSLRGVFPDARIFAWVGARVENISLDSALFRQELIRSIQRLGSEGFAGVHFDFEPMIDYEPGYLELLAEVRDELGQEFLISQATPRASFMGLFPGPLRRSYWSGGFYTETMQRSNQTVLMAYDSGLDFITPYIAFVRHQTGLLMDWGCSIPGHEILIGVPAYEDVPLYSNPQVENLRTASLGVRSAIEANQEKADCVVGVSIYSNWVTDEGEWKDFRSHWMESGATQEYE